MLNKCTFLILCVVTIDHLGMLIEDLIKIEIHWRRLGRALKIEEHILARFSQSKDHKEYLIKVLLEWMAQKADEATLKNFIML